MTESEWLACNDPKPMLEFLLGKASERKLRLYAGACCRRRWHLFSDNQDRQAVELAEQFTGGEVGVHAVEDLRQGIDWTKPGVAKYVVYPSVSGAVQCVISGVEQSLVEEGATAEAKRALSQEGETAEEARQAGVRAYTKALGQVSRDVRFAHAHLLRDITNPFCVFSISGTWLTPTVTSLTTAAYEERLLPSGELDTTRLAVLADAMEEAGCTNADILNHLREPGVHVRGCWVVDLLLGKE